jgi:hypothetical protein
MIKKEKIYIKDIAKAPYFDRFFYYLLNHLGTDIFDRDYMTINPLKWCLMTVIVAAYTVFVYLVVTPVVGIPLLAYDAHKMPKLYESSEFNGYYQNDVYLLRELPANQ